VKNGESVFSRYFGSKYLGTSNLKDADAKFEPEGKIIRNQFLAGRNVLVLWYIFSKHFGR